MAPRMTLAEIERAFPREWIVAIDFVTGDSVFLKEGVVVFHSPDQQAALRAAKLVGSPVACWYVGRPKRAASGLLGFAI